MRRGFATLAAQAEKSLGQNPYAGHLFVFRGRRGDLLKIIWFDGQGACLFSKRLEKGRFVWPYLTRGGDQWQSSPHSGTVVDAAGRHRLAHAQADVETAESGINTQAFTAVLGFHVTVVPV